MLTMLLLAGCNKQLKADLAACQSDLTDCTTTSGTCTTDLATCQADLAQAQFDLAEAEYELDLAALTAGGGTVVAPLAGPTPSDQLMPGTVEVRNPTDLTYGPAGKVLTYHDPSAPLQWKEVWYVMAEAATPTTPTYKDYVGGFKTAGNAVRLDWINDCGGAACAALPGALWQQKAEMNFNYVPFPSTASISNLPSPGPSGTTTYTFDVYNADNAGTRTPEPTGVLFRELRVSPTGVELFKDHWVLFAGDVEDDGDDNTFFSADADTSVDAEPRSSSYADLKTFLQAMDTLRLSSDPTTGWTYVYTPYKWQ